MLIRSKTKASLVNIEAGILTAETDGTVVFHSNVDEKNVMLGRYSTIEKTIEVMDRIQEAYDTYERCKRAGDSWGFETFQMPNDDEVKQNV